MKTIFLTPFMLLACAGTTSKTAPSLPEGYNYENIQEISLEKDLEEISGIEYDGNQAFLAHNDEEGVVYKLDGEYKIRETFPFAEEGDYEEIKKIGEELFVLGSKGQLWSMPYDGTKPGDAVKHEWPGKKTEFESMFYDEGEQQLILVSKNSKLDKEARTTHGYAFDPGEKQFSEEAAFNLSWDEAGEVAGRELKGLHPSGAAVHPLTGEIYLLASIEKLLLVLTPGRQVKEVHELDKKRFPQAEGITFDEKGNLYISNEAAESEKATLLIFPYQTSR